MIPDEAVAGTDNAGHWLVFRDAAGWGCQGCDWTGTLEDFWTKHERRTDDINIPF